MTVTLDLTQSQAGLPCPGGEELTPLSLGAPGWNPRESPDHAQLSTRHPSSLVLRGSSPGSV